MGGVPVGEVNVEEYSQSWLLVLFWRPFLLEPRILKGQLLVMGLPIWTLFCPGFLALVLVRPMNSAGGLCSVSQDALYLLF